MSRTTVLSMTLCALVMSGPVSGACPNGSADNIREADSRWLGADGAHNVDGTTAIFEKDVVFQFQGAPDARWKEFKASYQVEFAVSADCKWTPNFDRIEVPGI